MHKETRTRFRAEKSEFSARKEINEAEEEIQASKNINATFDQAVDKITAAAQERLLPGFERQNVKYQPKKLPKNIITSKLWWLTTKLQIVHVFWLMSLVRKFFSISDTTHYHFFS